jgi:hypothetical protein
MPSLVWNSPYPSSFISASGYAISFTNEGEIVIFIESNSSNHVSSSTLSFCFVPMVL